MTQLSNTFTGAKHPRWGELPNDQKIEIREEWINERMIASGDPRNQKLHQQLVKEAYADVSQEVEEEPSLRNQALYNAISGGIPFAPILASIFGVGPKLLQERGGLVLRGLQAPREMMWRSFKEVGEGEGALPKQIGRAATQTAKYVKEGGEEVKLPEELEKIPLSSLWSDPLIWGVGKQIGHLGVRGVKQLAGKVTGRIRPPTGGFPSPTTGEAAETFNRTKLAEEAVKREALRATVKEAIPTTRTIGPPGWPTLRKEWSGIKTFPEDIRMMKNIKPKLAPHYAPDEIAMIREFVLQHPEDLITKSLLAQKRVTPEITREIAKRILFERPSVYKTMPTFKEASKKVVGGKPRMKPPTAATEESIAEKLNRPGGVADAYEVMGD